jgi:hypothetical protein
VPFWRRRRPVHQELAKGTDLLRWEPRYEPSIGFGAEATLDVLHGGRPRQWDAVVSAEAPLLTGEAVHFVALPDGTLIVDERVAHGALDPVVEALEQQLAPPYRAEAVRREGVWAAAANGIEVVELPEGVRGDTIELASRDGERELTVDGEPSLAPLPTLEQFAAARSEDYVARAERIDGDLWDVRVSAL